MTLFSSGNILRWGYADSIIAAFCALVGAVYEYFGHGVYSYHMIYAFAYPLLLGALPLLGMGIFGARKQPSLNALRIYHAGIATLTVGSFVRGALDIYGTENILTEIYPYAGGILVFIGVLVWLLAGTRDVQTNAQTGAHKQGGFRG